MLRLHGACIRDAIDERYGGSISRLAAALSLEPRPDRSTVTRWISSDGSHFPRDEERILALAGALDVDPTALWTFDTDTFPVLWPKITRAARTGKWSGLLTPLSFLRHFAEPADEWPPQPVANRFFEREWVVHELVHDPRNGANFYQNILLRPEAMPTKFPVVWHFAFCHTGNVHRREWKPFGFVKREAERVTLFNDWGITDQASCSPTDQETVVQTWYGPGAAVFRVASLHPFSLSLAKDAPPDVPTVHFGFPGEVR
ncbi:MAG TPA: hypothetical protein VF881_03380 [Polyangiaceae bacterium]